MENESISRIPAPMVIWQGRLQVASQYVLAHRPVPGTAMSAAVSSQSFERTLADLRCNLQIKLFNLVPLCDQVHVFLTREFLMQCRPHLATSLDIPHQLSYFVRFHNGAPAASDWRCSTRRINLSTE